MIKCASDVSQLNVDCLEYRDMIETLLSSGGITANVPTDRRKQGA